jgi:hypothetical protein
VKTWKWFLREHAKVMVHWDEPLSEEATKAYGRLLIDWKRAVDMKIN